MPNPTWPSTLPAPIADTSAAYSEVDNAVRSNTEAGVNKVRRRFTAVATPFTCTVKLTQTQYATLMAFYATTLLDVLPFDWLDFRTGAVGTYRFVKRPGGSYVAGSIDRWIVTLPLELLP